MIRKKFAFGMLALLSLFAFGSPAEAAPEFEFGSVTAFGSGCPAGTVMSMTNGNELIVLFSAMNAATAPFPGVPVNSCTVTANLILNRGFRLNVATINYSGGAVLGTSGGAMLSRRAFFAGVPGNTRTEVIGEGAFTITDREAFLSAANCRSTDAQRTITAGSSITLFATGSGAFVNLAALDTTVEDEKIRILFLPSRC